MNATISEVNPTIFDNEREISYSDIEKMYYENLRDAEECRRVTESSNRGETYYADGMPGEGKVNDWFLAFAKEVLYRDTKTDGFMMEYPHGIIIGQGERNSYYRGENQKYEKSEATLYREMARFDNAQDQELYRLIADMRIAEFRNFLYRMNITRFWQDNYGTVLFDPLAQHYGLKTEWLDITSDFNVALFFATCGWDEDRKEWYPLTKADTEKEEKKQYGVIFHTSGRQADLARMASTLIGNFKESVHNAIWPIGYQPFMRCHSQHAYGIHMEKPYLLQNDRIFERLIFRHNEKLSQNIFDMMEGGKKVYPQEGLNGFQDVIDSIKGATEFSDEAFEYAIEKNEFFTDKDTAIKMLQERLILGVPVSINGKNHPFTVSRQRIRRMNRKYERFSVEKEYGINIHYRLTCKPPAQG